MTLPVFKTSEETRAYYKEHYRKNKEFYKNRSRTRQKQSRVYLNKVKDESTCLVCGEADNCCLDFHHRDPSLKSRCLADAVRCGWSEKRLQEEIDKCDILCRNCHARVHAHV